MSKSIKSSAKEKESMTLNITKASVDRFKHYISDYEVYLKDLEEVKLMKLELDTKRGVKAIRYDAENLKGSKDPLMVQLARIEDIDRAFKIDEQIKQLENIVDQVKNFIETSELGQSAYKIYTRKSSTYSKEAQLHNMSVRNLKRKLNREIEKYLKVGTRYHS